MFRTLLCPSSGASQLHMQSLVPINYKNTCCLQICHYVYFIITTNYLCDTYKPTEPKLKTKQHKTNLEVKKRFIRVTQIICSNYKIYIMTYL